MQLGSSDIIIIYLMEIQKQGHMILVKLSNKKELLYLVTSCAV